MRNGAVRWVRCMQFFLALGKTDRDVIVEAALRMDEIHGVAAPWREGALAAETGLDVAN